MTSCLHLSLPAFPALTSGNILVSRQTWNSRTGNGLLAGSSGFDILPDFLRRLAFFLSGLSKVWSLKSDNSQSIHKNIKWRR